jgi:hypothetical protein
MIENNKGMEDRPNLSSERRYTIFIYVFVRSLV